MVSVRGRLAELLDAQGAEYDDMLDGVLRQADRFWMRHHGQVIRELHPGSSLLRDKLQSTPERKRRVRPGALHLLSRAQRLSNDDYDSYFGVRRVSDMMIGDYWTQAVAKLAAVHRAFAMDAETRTALMRGDGTMLAIISDNLAHEEPNDG